MRIQLVILAAAANAAMLKLDSQNEALLNANEIEAEAGILAQAGFMDGACMWCGTTYQWDEEERVKCLKQAQCI